MQEKVLPEGCSLHVDSCSPALLCLPLRPSFSCYTLLSPVSSLFLVLISFSPPGEAQKMKSWRTLGVFVLLLGLSSEPESRCKQRDPAAFSRKPICRLIDVSKDKTLLYFCRLGHLKICKQEGGWKQGSKTLRHSCLTHVGQGFVMIYRLVRGLVLSSAKGTEGP